MQYASLVDDGIAAAQSLVRELERLSDHPEASQRVASDLSLCNIQLVDLCQRIRKEIGA